MFADLIVRELREPADSSSREMARLDLGLDPAEGVRLLDLAVKPGADREEPAVLAALEQARTLAATPYPVGTVRADWIGDHPLLVRATGADWSLLARPSCCSMPSPAVYSMLPGRDASMTFSVASYKLQRLPARTAAA